MSFVSVSLLVFCFPHLLWEPLRRKSVVREKKKANAFSCLVVGGFVRAVASRRFSRGPSNLIAVAGGARLVRHPIGVSQPERHIPFARAPILPPPLSK